MAHVEPGGAALHHALQFTGYGVRIIFERRTDGAAKEGNAADQDPDATRSPARTSCEESSSAIEPGV